MHRLAPLLAVFMTLVLQSGALADARIEALTEALDNHDSYSLEITGRDENGEFTATYFYSPEVRVLSREDRDGNSLYLYNKLSRPDKVMVTRRGVAYRYRLDNPRLPAFFPESLLEHYLGKALRSGASQGDGESAVYHLEDDRELVIRLEPDGRLAEMEVRTAESGLSIYSFDSLVFDPDLDGPEYSKLSRYISRVR